MRYLLFFILFLFLGPATDVSAASGDDNNNSLLHQLSRFQDRGTGTEGYKEAGLLIEKHFSNLGFNPKSYLFPVAIRSHSSSSIEIQGQTYPLHPFTYNAITPEAVVPEVTAPLCYVGKGSFAELEGKKINQAIILMDFDSGKNWQQVASLGAKAIIYLDNGSSRAKHFFKEKEELTPIQLPCFWMDSASVKTLFPNLQNINDSPNQHQARISSPVQWQEITARNIYCLIPGSGPKLQEELLVIEAFYDGSSYIPGKAPAADEAVSVATMLGLADFLQKNPPSRSVLLVATSGHAQTLAGMRDLIWSINSSSREMRQQKKLIQKQIAREKAFIATLSSLSFPLSEDPERDQELATAIEDQIKLSVDTMSRELMQLRLQESNKNKKNSTDTSEEIKKKVAERMAFRRLSWKNSFHDLAGDEQQLLQNIIPLAIARHKTTLAAINKQKKYLASAKSFRTLVRQYDLAGIISLHLSTHGTGVGGFHRGSLYSLKPVINRTGIYSTIADVLQQGAEKAKTSYPYVEALRSDRLRSWDSWFLEPPPLGGEISSIAGYLGLSLVTTGDSRALWGTPWDVIESVDLLKFNQQLSLITTMASELANAPKLHDGRLPRNGFASVTGRANLLLQGELFANYPASGTTLLSYQGKSTFHTIVDPTGTFKIKGIADKKHVYDKLIIEGYRFDQSGEPIWAIDKKQTGKANYRLKIRRRSMKTDLIMFSCRQTTIFDLLEPRSFKHMTKMQILDGRRDATPLHYWYSRIDTRKSIIASLFTEPGSHLKLTLSDSILTRKLILTNGSKETPMGLGYPVDSYPAIYNTSFHAASDAWTLLTPRITNLENHGIFDANLNTLQNRGTAALALAESSLANFSYGTAREAAAESLALAGRVYVQIEKNQKDILFGVLFYIALFVPFAFCAERFLCNYANIYKRIVAFTAILLLLIVVIYNVHPAFQLAYSPMVVILAFFILGLSFMVSMIIFMRFEEEMILLQRRSTHKKPAEISQWKAFMAAFFLGVSNLRRRRLRTILTCTTLIILTFTIMSFTTIKSNKGHNQLFFQEDVPYKGLLLKKMDWQSLPPESAAIINNRFAGKAIIAPRCWLEAPDPSRPVHVPLTNGANSTDIRGLIGFSAAEQQVTDVASSLSSGRWFQKTDRQTIILEESMARSLGVQANGHDTVKLWDMEFKVIGVFAAARLEALKDLDGESLTPVTFPEASAEATSDIEQEAIASGDDIRSFQGRYHHIPATQTAFIPFPTLMAMGGQLKNIALQPESGVDTPILAANLVDRFSLAIFAGEDDGVWLYNLKDTMSYSGVPDIIIPLLISIFIVLNTMIGSVYERKGEISIYTSIGLAPSHVSFLFVAEAMALAVISVVLGYLLAQTSAFLLCSTVYWQGITVNYSSLAGVAAMILVIFVVLISVIYPSRLAARIAIPDVNRSFSLPEPVNNSLEVTLPFLMKYDEYESIGGFMHDYLTGHQDVSHGLFSTGPIELHSHCDIPPLHDDTGSKPPLCCLHVRAKVWLAPFDFGIMQWIDLKFSPSSDSAGFIEITLSIERRSGEVNFWKRINTSFIHEIRKQLLIWRSMDSEAHDHYRDALKSIVAGEVIE